MKLRLVYSSLFVSVAAVSLSRAQGLDQAPVEDDEQGAQVVHNLEADPALAGYSVHIAAHATAVPLLDGEQPSLCQQDEILWHRDAETLICVPMCSSDTDCIEGLERCAAVAAPGVALDRAFVDDDVNAPYDVEVGNAVAICDPFFDFEV